MGASGTRLAMGGVLLLMFAIFSLFFLTQIGNQYSVVLETQYDTQTAFESDLTAASTNVDEKTAQIEQAGIDNQDTDTAQAQQVLLAEQKNLDWWSLLNDFFQQIQVVFPASSFVWAGLAIIFGILVTFTFTRIFLNRDP